MCWRNCVLPLLCLLPGCSGALEESLSRGAELQRSEQPAEALRNFREARVEYPEAADLVFAMAGAEAALGDQFLAAHDLEEALRQFEAARATFGRCGDARLAESAAYNAATCLLRLDQVLERKGDYTARVENLKRAVEALSAVTDTWPGNVRAVKNLDYARYRLALLLQEPPSPEEEEKENPEEDDKPVSEVAGATTQIPGATAEVVDGAMVVLHVERAGGDRAMKGVPWILALLALFGQDDTVEKITPTTPEVVRVLAIQARTVEGAPRYLDTSLEEVRELLEKMPGNQFTETGFFELEAHYDRDAVADLGGGYTLSFQPSELTELDEILFECHIDLTEGGRTVEALRVTGKAVRGQGAVFRGLTLPEGELVVVMSIAKEEEESGRGGSGGSGQEQGGAGDGGAGAPGEDGAGDGETNESEEEPSTVPELQSRQLQVEPEPSEDTPEGGETIAAGEGAVPPDRATVEGILRALEEQDMAEQKSARGRRFDVVMKGDWW